MCVCVCVHPDSKLRAMVNFSDCKAGGGSRVQSATNEDTLDTLEWWVVQSALSSKAGRIASS